MGYAPGSLTRLKDTFEDAGAHVWWTARAALTGLVRWLLEKEAAGVFRLVMEMEQMQSDETPLRFSHKDKDRRQSKDSEALVPAPTTAVLQATGTSTQTKLLQVSVTYTFVVQKDGEYRAFATHLPCGPMSSDSMKGEALVELQNRQLHVPMLQEMRARFEYHLSIIETDREGTNWVANRLRRRAHPQQWQLADHGCQTHDVHRASGNCPECFATLVSGCVNLALLEDQGGNTDRVRQSLVEVLKKVVFPIEGGHKPEPTSEMMRARGVAFSTLTCRRAKGRNFSDGPSKSYSKAMCENPALPCTCLRRLQIQPPTFGIGYSVPLGR